MLSKLPGRVHVGRDPAAVAETVADAVSDAAATAQARDGRFAIALAGGTTPEALYHRLATEPLRSHVDWARWQVYFSDERAVPPDDPASNYGLARRVLLDTVPIPPVQVRRMRAEDPDLDLAADAYSSILTSTLGRPPRLDCVLLGLGPDGHTASLFPRTRALDIADAYVTPGLADHEPFDRVTMTFAAINAARSVMFTVTGASKGAALRGVVEGTVPAARVAPTDGELLWFLDDDAARSME